MEGDGVRTCEIVATIAQSLYKWPVKVEAKFLSALALGGARSMGCWSLAGADAVQFLAGRVVGEFIKIIQVVSGFGLHAFATSEDWSRV